MRRMESSLSAAVTEPVPEGWIRWRFVPRISIARRGKFSASTMTGARLATTHSMTGPIRGNPRCGYTGCGIPIDMHCTPVPENCLLEMSGGTRGRKSIEGPGEPTMGGPALKGTCRSHCTNRNSPRASPSHPRRSRPRWFGGRTTMLRHHFPDTIRITSAMPRSAVRSTPGARIPSSTRAAFSMRTTSAAGFVAWPWMRPGI